MARRVTRIAPAGEPDIRVLTFQPHPGQVTERRYQRQAAHHKSRTGCLTCKARRVKCDEGKPCCLRCAQRYTQCVYHSDKKSPQGLRTTEQPGVGSGPLVASNHKTIFPPMQPATETRRVVGISKAALIHHFTCIFPELTSGNVEVAPILALGLYQHQFLLDAALAVSASHLRCHVVSKQQCRVAEHFQQSRAIPNFHRALQRRLDQPLADALVLTSILMNVLSFSCVDDDAGPSQSWLFGSDAQRLGWFSVNLGLKALIQRTGSYQHESILCLLYNAADDDRHTFYGAEKSMDRIPEHWSEFLQLDSSPTGSILREPARFLSEVKDLEPTRQSFFLYVNFMGALDVDFKFRDMLLQHDERAICLLGYWMGLLCRFDYWWLRARAKLEWRATCIWMEQQTVLATPGGKQDARAKVMRDLVAANVWAVNGTADRHSS